MTCALSDSPWEFLEGELNGFWSIDWTEIFTTARTVLMDEEDKARLTILVMKYVQTNFVSGHLQNLDGMEPVLDLLDIGRIAFPREVLEELLELYGEYDLGFLYSMSPTLYDKKLRGGRVYDKVAYTRGLLNARGVPQEKLTDEYIERLWELREILVRFHYVFLGRPPLLTRNVGLLELLTRLK